MRARAIYILNDLYVVPAARRKRVGTVLLDRAVAHARERGAARLTLSTAHDNEAAQAAYQQAGWKADEAFRVYNFGLD